MQRAEHEADDLLRGSVHWHDSRRRLARDEIENTCILQLARVHAVDAPRQRPEAIFSQFLRD